MITDASVNFGPRRHGLPPDMVVLHYTAMSSCQAAIDRLCDPVAEVSAHYVISEQGDLHLLVPEEMRAWHAGAGGWGQVRDVNSHSIGIELANSGPLSGYPPFPEPQMQRLEHVLTGIIQRWNIPPERVIGHSDMAPGRKTDPGRKFDWQRLALQHLSVWIEPTGPKPADWAVFKSKARQFGYVPMQDDTAGWREVLASFRLRFAPASLGPLSPHDIALISALADHYPCADVDLGTTKA